ncbi:bifunctional shikimate kinase/3-dehydroquinate synthase [Bifidobacterium simiarum]|uniref:Multifunctional fusion protein n=1 Tax=Bifidobacterium simiarum TaxID=2045441 RepID=A0A2M9HC29_9BIFI|nr:bifunctional shikimate kinase/3-dehydroquinate synthase [Bifidobacterium simiarum]PJM74378.1 3-dehydroquinate synthase [Bifidobacterium simiarum]
MRPKAVLIGMPGSGKTRIGGDVATLLDVEFRDSDIDIEDREGMKIPRIFEERGEAEFRRIEADVIIEALHGFDGVLSLGGGAPMTVRTRDELKRYIDAGGTVVYLDADPNEAIARASRSGNRPLLADGAAKKWRRLYAERHDIYVDLANLIAHTKGKTPMQAAQQIADTVNERVVHIDGLDPYDVRIGSHVVNHLADVLGEAPVRIALIHTTPVQRHSDRVRALLRRAGYEVSDITIPDAEAGKTVEVANGIWKRLGDEGFTRSDAVVGLGGGAATDLAGFVAATWMRGIAYVNCPTSLLAMVDASTGGKTGINTEAGKNLVGSFYTPKGVLADLTTLGSLPNDIFVEGLGEVAKSGFIEDTEILRVLEEHADQLRTFDPNTITPELEAVIAELIERTVTVKAHHVSTDLKEKGKREFLNYGHTMGHAVEKLEHFRWRHGNAVAVGMVYAAELANILGYIDRDLVEYHRSLLSSLGLPTSWNDGSFEDVLALMHKDKKARGNMLRFVVLDRPGHVVHLENPPADAVEEAFRRVQQ